jgi:MFS family permease
MFADMTSSADQVARAGRIPGSLLAAYAFAVAMAGTTLPTPLYPLYRDEFHFSQFLVTVIFATYAVGVIAALLVFGSISDVVGRRRALLPGLVLSALSAVAFLLAPSLTSGGIGLLLVGRFVSGLSAGIFTGTATVAVVELAAPENRTRATLWATIANLGGLGCGPLLAGLLAEYVGAPLRLVFVVDLVLLVPAVAAVLLMRETVAEPGGFALKVQRPTVPEPVRAVFIRGSIAGFAGFSVLGLFTAIAPAFLGQVLGVHNAAAVGLIVFAVFAASILGQLTLGRMSGNTGLAVGCAGLAVGMGVLASGLALSSLALLVVGGCVAGFGQGLSFRAALASVNRESPPDQRAAVASTFFVVAYVALSLPVLGVGLLAREISLRAAGLIFAGVVIALALLAIVLLLRSSAGRRQTVEA